MNMLISILSVQSFCSLGFYFQQQWSLNLDVSAYLENKTLSIPKKIRIFLNIHDSVKSVRIQSYSGPHCPAFGLNTESCGVSLRIQAKCEKTLTRITPNADFFLQSMLWKVFTFS